MVSTQFIIFVVLTIMSSSTPEQAASTVTLLTCVRSVTVSYRGRNAGNSVAFSCSFIVPLDIAGITPEIMGLRSLCGKGPHLLLRGVLVPHMDQEP
jgi:hypothetical protein